jgi:hypothetical protein
MQAASAQPADERAPQRRAGRRSRCCPADRPSPPVRLYQTFSWHTVGGLRKGNCRTTGLDDIHSSLVAAFLAHAPLREEPKPSRERRRYCVCAFKRAPLSAGRNHVSKSPGGLLVPGDTGGNGTLERRWRQPVPVPETAPEQEDKSQRTPPLSHYISWSELLRRTFQIDTTCPHCKTPLRLIALIKTDDTIKKSRRWRYT